MQVLWIGSILSFLFSCIAALLLIRFRVFLGQNFLKEPRTSALLLPLALSLPFCAIHSCINSYYYGQKKTLLPSVILLIEQGVRVLSVCILCQVLISEGGAPGPLLALYGTLISEVVSALLSILAVGVPLRRSSYSLHPRKQSCLLSQVKNLLQLALPLSANRILLTLFSSIEAAFIPWQLQKYGNSISQALATYGIFTGMALPLLLLPTTVTNSIATMLLPSFAELQALGKEARIQKAIQKLTLLGFSFGSICGGFYFFFGEKMGILLFRNEMVGGYLQILAFICPFLYLNTTFSGVLHGLGFGSTTLLHNLISITIRLFFVVFWIPQHGILGYLWGILVGELTLFFLNLLFFYRQTSKNIL